MNETTQETPKPRKGSISYSLKAIEPHLDTIIEGGYLSGEVGSKFKKELRNAKERYIKEKYGL